MPVIHTFCGKEILVSRRDLSLVKGYKWHYNRFERVVQCSRYVNGKTKNIKIHRLILGITDPKIKIDHKNRSSLDNRRSNLRVATDAQNSANQSKRKTRCSSKYKGVCLHAHGKWMARIKVNYIGYHLGYFEKEEDAARTYDKAAKKHFGKFANLNFKK